MRISRFILGAVFSVSIIGSGLSAEIAPGDVKINDDFEITASLSGKAGDAVTGREWYADRKLGNCLACHVTTELKELDFHGEVGPSMDGVAERYNANQLRAILTDSKKIFGEQTIMPGFYSTDLGIRVLKKFKGKTILSAQQVEDVIAYLQTLK